MTELERKFNKAMINIYKQAKKELNYSATRLLQLVSEKGGVLAAKQLIAVSGGTQGFSVLYENKRLDLSIEALVINPEYQELFSQEEIDICNKRLKEYEYL